MASEETALLGKEQTMFGLKRKQAFFLCGWFLSAVAWICGGVAAGMVFEGWSVLTSFYVIVQIVTTIGYGDVTVHSEGAKLFMAIYVLVTLVLIASFLTDAVAKFVSRNEDFLRSRLRAVQVKMADKTGVQDEEQARTIYGTYNELLSASALFWVYAGFGTVFFWWYEDCSCSYGVSGIDGCEDHLGYEHCDATGGATKSLIDAFYMSVITLTTVGFGDHTPRSWNGRLIGCFWMLFGVVATANMVSKVSAVLQYNNQEGQRLQSMSRDIYKKIDANQDGSLSLHEFRSFALIKFGVITEAELDEIDQIFKAIDKDQSGALSFEEVMEYCDN